MIFNKCKKKFFGKPVLNMTKIFIDLEVIELLAKRNPHLCFYYELSEFLSYYVTFDVARSVVVVAPNGSEKNACISFRLNSASIFSNTDFEVGY